VFIFLRLHCATMLHSPLHQQDRTEQKLGYKSSLNTLNTFLQSVVVNIEDLSLDDDKTTALGTTELGIPQHALLDSPPSGHSTGESCDTGSWSIPCASDTETTSEKSEPNRRYYIETRSTSGFFEAASYTEGEHSVTSRVAVWLQQLPSTVIKNGAGNQGEASTGAQASELNTARTGGSELPVGVLQPSHLPESARKTDDGDSSSEDSPQQEESETSLEHASRFACPFFKRDPQKYMAHRACPGPGWITVHRVKYAFLFMAYVWCW